ncbi:hypothetical protein D9611_011118 [Ephemerocybe angulata]|uniref:Uncharacterized protein n=1 Tax=Ephemerocybe angulata TaxID=980116 RepID=A0A8H5FJJ4_9AGAR|nr:hypothetical protein D9611_011118 [Tulosesus angulatus]
MHEHTTPPVASLSTSFKRLNVNAAGLMKKLGSQAERHRNQPLSSVELAELLLSEAGSSTRAKPHAIWDEGVKIRTRLSLVENKVQMSSLCLRGRVFHLQPLWFPSIHSLLSGSAASLTHLHLDRLGLDYHDWAAILPSWTFPALEFFKVEYVQIPFPVLMAFLQRHPTIVSATLLIFTIVGSLKMSNSPSLDYLPRLKQLVATPPFLLTLFKQRLRVGPNIGGLNISREHRHPPPPDVGTFDDITQVLSQISPSIWPSLCTLSLVLPCVSGLDEWLSHSLNSNPSHVDRGEIHIPFLRLFRNYGSDKRADSKLTALDKITTLNLFFPEQRNNLDFRLDGDTLITAAFDFIAAFPALKDVYMRGSLDQFLPEAAHDFYPQLGDLVLMRRKRCANLERLEIHCSGLTGSGCEFDSVVRERPPWLPKKFT